MEHILDFTNEALKNFLTEKGQKAFRANQLFEWLYRRQISSFDEIDNMKKRVHRRFETMVSNRPIDGQNHSNQSRRNKEIFI